MAENKLTHLDAAGRAAMVDVGHKAPTVREATAEGFVTLQPATLAAIAAGTVPKGEVLAVARVAGIMAAKRTAELIPLCHPLPIDSVSVEFDLPDAVPGSTEPVRLGIQATARVTARTGVEMEALTAVTLAALTIYDMCKAIDKQMAIGGVRLVRKTGGTSQLPTGTTDLPPRPHSLGEDQ
jgi:cyclic pyranopterin phosphate synthase